MSVVSCLVILSAINLIAGANMVCPYANAFWHPPQTCVNECSPDKNTCEIGKKCCYTPVSPCGLRCVVAKNDKPKKGKCPPTGSTQKDLNWILCDAHLCDVDGDCRSRKRCCQNKCGANVCIRPQ